MTQFNKDMCLSYAEKIPAVKKNLKAFHGGAVLSDADALTTALAIFQCNQSLDASSVAQTFGLDEDTFLDQAAEVLSAAREAAEEKAIADAEKEKARKAKEEKKIQKALEDRAEAAIPDACDLPELSESEEGMIIQDLYNAKFSIEKRARNTVFGSTDLKLAQIAHIVLGHSNCRRLNKTNYWYVWQGCAWEQRDAGAVRVLLGLLSNCIETDLKAAQTRRGQEPRWGADLVTRRYNLRDVSIAETVFQRELKTMSQMVARLQSSQGLDAVTRLLGDRLTITTEELDRNVDELVFRNKTWDAKRNSFGKHNRQSLATRYIDLDWYEPRAEVTEEWNTYLKGLGFNDQTIEFLKRSFGYSALGRGSAKRFWWFRGETHTSKTTLIELVKGCLGSYAVTTDPTMWLAKNGGSNGHNDQLATLQGARFVHADEFPKVCKFDEALMKRATGGGQVKLSASHKGEKTIEFHKMFSLFCSSNYDPYIADDDSASIGRLTALTFTQVIDDKVKDENFVEKFLAKPDMKMAILQWLMEGALTYLKEGLGADPESVVNSRKEYVQDQISIKDQIEQLVKAGPASKPLRRSAILQALQELQKQTRQHAPLVTRHVTKALEELFKVKGYRSNGDTVFPGLILRDDVLDYSKMDKITSGEPDQELDFGPTDYN